MILIAHIAVQIIEFVFEINILFQLSNDEEKAAFVDDYRITACISILQWFCMEYKKLGTAGVESFEAKARRSVVEFSLLRYN